MLHILLLLLKIIGVVLLVLIGLLVLVILAVLFVPVRYSLHVEAQEGLNVSARVSWLLHLLHAGAVYDGEFRVVIRLFGIPIRRMPEPEKKTSPRNRKHRRKKQPAEEEPAEKSFEPEFVTPDVEADTVQPAKTDRSDDRTTAGTDDAPLADKGVCIKDDAGADDTESGQDGQEREKRSFFHKLARFFLAVRAFFSKILYTIRNICDKIEQVKETAAYYLEVLKSDEGRRSFALMKRELGKLLRHIAPTKLTGSLMIGMDDPAATGQIIAIVSMFYPIYGDNVSITPDFDGKCLKGSLYLKGRIRAVTLIRIAWRIYFNKDIKKFLHMLKREENKHDGE